MKTVVRHKDGTINVQASVKAYLKKVSSWLKQEKALNKKYEKAVKEVFKKFPKGAVISKPALGALVCQHLGATVDNYRKMTKEYEHHVRINKNGYLSVKPGFGGGVRLSKP